MGSGGVGKTLMNSDSPGMLGIPRRIGGVGKNYDWERPWDVGYFMVKSSVEKNYYNW